MRHAFTRLPLAIAALAALASAQSWSLANPTTSPPAQGFQPSLAYHLGTLRTLMYGGRTSVVSADTWVYDGSSWTLLSPANSPGPKWGHRLAYDWARNRVVLFGGRDAGTTAQNDTWAFDGQDWAQINTANAPSPRAWHQMAYDKRRDRVVVFGGFAVRDGSTWEFDGTDWTAVVTANRPPIVGDGEMVYDESRGVCVLFGGWDGSAGVYAGTWEYDGIDWRSVATVNAPSGRTWHQMSYDRLRAHAVLHGGFGGGVQTDTWTYDGADWTLHTPGGTPPSVPLQGGMTYDVGRDRHVFFGGSGPGGLSADTNEYTSLAYASYARAGEGCAGSAGVPVLEAVGGSVPRPGGTLTAQVSNLPASTSSVFVLFGSTNLNFGPWGLPYDLAVVGMPSCRLDCSPDLAFPVTAAGGVAGFSLPVPPGLGGVTFWTQAFVPDPAAGNGAGAVLSNGCRGQIFP